MFDEAHQRSRALLGEAPFRRLASAHVAVFGVGGVGGWFAEALVRTGARRLTLIDDDFVAASNMNRQPQALPATVGHPKVEVLRDMLLAISPDAEITARQERYTPETSRNFAELLCGTDFVVDAIDSVDCKAHLILTCTSVASCQESQLPILFSSMGAALRMDPTAIRTAPFSKVEGDGLARALRNRFRKMQMPLPNHICVYSKEPPKKTGGEIKGNIMPVTCAFGMALAALVLAECTPAGEAQFGGGGGI